MNVCDVSTSWWEDGQTELDDLLKARVTALKLDRETAREALARAQSTRQQQIVIDEARVEAFGRLMRERLTTGEIPFRKAYLGTILDRVEVDEGQVRLFGRKDMLEHAVAAGAQDHLPVRTFVRRWRTGQDCHLVVKSMT
jgi:site-specific DNA recombinase